VIGYKYLLWFYYAVRKLERGFLFKVYVFTENETDAVELCVICSPVSNSNEFYPKHEII
jgi:hypothetical protein